MGTNLERWAARQEGLSEKNFRVLLAMCMVAHDNTGKFFISVHKFLTDDRYRKIHRMPSHSALRQHYLALVRKGFIGRIRKGNGKLGPKKDKYNTPKGSRTIYQILAYGELPNEAFTDYEEAVRRRGDPAPPHAQARLPMLTDMSPKPHIQELQDVSPKPHIQELQDVSPKPHIQEPGCEPQTSHPKQHDDHSNDHVQSASQTGALSPSDRSDLEVFCIAASAIDITGLLPDDLTGITGALHAYRGLQRRRPVVEIARRVANEVKRTMPDDGRADHKRVVGWFMSVASTTLRRGGGVSVAGTTRNPGKLHSDFPPQEGKEDWRVEYERAQKWHESQRGDIASGGG